MKETKEIELNKKQIEAINNGATSFIILPDFLDNDEEKVIVNLYQNGKGQEAREKWGFELPLQIAQKFFVQEEFAIHQRYLMSHERDSESKYSKPVVIYRDTTPWSMNWYQANEMEEYQSRIKGTVLNVKVVKIQELDIDQVSSLNYDGIGTLEGITDSIYGKGTYESNPYVFIYTFKKEQ